VPIAPGGRALLICVLHHDEQAPPAFAGLLERGTAQRLRLGPLGNDAAATPKAAVDARTSEGENRARQAARKETTCPGA
jgi:hypothetical protein